MSGDDRDLLRDLAKDLPWDKPDADRREALRSSLLVAAAEDKAMPRKWWLVAGCAFAAGVLAAAAIALVVMRPADRGASRVSATEPAPTTTSPTATAPTATSPTTTSPTAPVQGEPTGYAQIDASSAAELERTRVASATGVDETVRIRGGSVRLVVPPVRAGDRVRAKTADAEIEGTGAFEIVVVADALDRVTVTSGTASIRIASDSRPVFLSAGESWTAKTITASIDLTPSRPSQSPATSKQVAETWQGPVPSATAATAKTATSTSTPAPTTSQTAPSIAAAPSTASAAAPTTTTTKAAPSIASASSPTASSPTSKAAPSIASASSPTASSPTSRAAPSVASAVSPTASSPTSKAAPSIAAAPTTTPPLAKVRTETERHLQAGLALERAGKHAEAAIELGLAADAGTGELAVDARYFQAASLVKAGMSSAAERALVEFLDHAPTSVRRGRAAVMLARLYAVRGNTLAARQWYESAKDDPDAAVARAARQELDALR